MNINIKHANTLPTPTWRWLKLNDTTIECENTGNYAVVKPEIINLPKELTLANQKPADFPKVLTGVGEEAREFAEAHAGKVNHLTVPANYKAELPVIFKYELIDGNFFVDDTYIHAQKDSKVTVVLAYNSPFTAGGFHGSSVKVWVEENAEVEVIQLQTLGNKFYNFDDIGVTSNSEGKVTIKQIEIGGHKNWLGIQVDMSQPKSETHIVNHYLAGENQHLDVNYLVKILGKKTDTTILSKGILLNNAQKTFRGTLDFQRGCSGSVGNESEDVILLDENVVNKSIPIILCGEDDIQGDHAASIGEMDEQQLFYLGTRGLDSKQVRRMVIESKLAIMQHEVPEELHGLVEAYKQEAFHYE